MEGEKKIPTKQRIETTILGKVEAVEVLVANSTYYRQSSNDDIQPRQSDGQPRRV